VIIFSVNVGLRRALARHDRGSGGDDACTQATVRATNKRRAVVFNKKKCSADAGKKRAMEKLSVGSRIDLAGAVARDSN
jgi:hypothetical protein